MKTHLNTLFVTLEGAYLKLDGAAVDVRVEKESKLRVPLHILDGIVTFGWDTTASAALMAACAENGVTLSFCTPHGKFLAAATGFTPGNILLRREQYRRADSEAHSLGIARNMVTAKVANTRAVLLRALRDHGDKSPERAPILQTACDYMANRLQVIPRAATLNELRGLEGECAMTYFGAFPQLLTNHDARIRMNGRSRRPPLDPVNCLLSFLYAMLTHDLRSACESCGLDPQCGFLHRDRPGRASLALDLMEEFRPVLAERLALSLLNRQQITADDFDVQENGAVKLKDKARKAVLTAWQERKRDELVHPFLEERITIGLLPHLQARLLARHLRGDLDAYPAFLWK
jgi:CRISP-associated protein Cas1